MKRTNIVILICLFFISLISNGQTISDLSMKICDSINSHNYTKSDTIALKQAEIYSNFIGQYYLNSTQGQLKNWQSDLNSLNYKLTRELNKDCDSFKIQNSFILPFTNLIEIDSVFSEQQSKRINEIAKDIRIKNQMEIVILSIDEIYPKENILDFSASKLDDWNIGGVLEKSGLIIVFSQKLRLLRISTTEIAKQYLSDSECEGIVSDIMIPNFKKGNYYEGILDSLYKIKELTK
jgi:hypothetical protein